MDWSQYEDEFLALEKEEENGHEFCEKIRDISKTWLGGNIDFLKPIITDTVNTNGGWVNFTKNSAYKDYDIEIDLDKTGGVLIYYTPEGTIYKVVTNEFSFKN